MLSWLSWPLADCLGRHSLLVMDMALLVQPLVSVLLWDDEDGGGTNETQIRLLPSLLANNSRCCCGIFVRESSGFLRTLLTSGSACFRILGFWNKSSSRKSCWRPKVQLNLPLLLWLWLLLLLLLGWWRRWWWWWLVWKKPLISFLALTSLISLFRVCFSFFGVCGPLRYVTGVEPQRAGRWWTGVRTWVNADNYLD